MMVVCASTTQTTGIAQRLDSKSVFEKIFFCSFLLIDFLRRWSLNMYVDALDYKWWYLFSPLKSIISPKKSLTRHVLQAKLSRE